MQKKRKIFKLLLIFFLFFSSSTLTLSQESGPYELSYKKDLPLFFGGIILSTTGHVIRNKIKVFNSTDLQGLDRMEVNRFDRSATYNLSSKAGMASDIFLYSSGGILLSLSADKGIRNDFLTISLMFMETFLISNGITFIAKHTAQRSRPLVYNPNADIELKKERSARQSYFSGHTSLSASVCFFSAKVITDYHPDSKWKPLIWAGAATIPTITGFLRYEAGKHYPTDIITGYAVGAILGWGVPWLHKKNRLPKELSIIPIVDDTSMQLGIHFSY